MQIALRQIRETPPPLPADVPGGPRQLVERMLAKDPAQRPPDGAAVLAALDDVGTGNAPTATSGRARTRVLTPLAAVGTTRVPPAEAAAPAGSVLGRSGHHLLRRPLVPLVALLAPAVLAGAVLLGTSDSAPPAGEPAATTTPAPPPGMEIVPSAYVGRPLAEVRAELTGRGLVVQPRPLQTADVPDGQVIAVDPAGRLPSGAAVTVVHGVAPPPPAPAPAPVQDEEEKEKEEERKDRAEEQREKAEEQREKAEEREGKDD